MKNGADAGETAVAMLKAGKSKAEVWDALVAGGVEADTATALVSALGKLREEALPAAASTLAAPGAQGAPSTNELELAARPVPPRPLFTDGAKLVLTAFVIVGAVVVGSVVFLGPSAGNAPSPATGAAQAADDKIAAWVMAQGLVRERLKSPGSADFGSVLGEYQDPNACVADIGAGRYRVRGWVDSQNSFGAKVRTSFSVTLEHTSNDTWLPVEGPELRER